MKGFSSTFKAAMDGPKPGLELQKLLDEVRSYNPRADLDFITHAYRFSEMAHKDQSRRSGEPYMFHCVEVARILAGLHMDTATIAAGLLHDVVEDTSITIEQVRDEFGEEISVLIDGVTKIGGLRFRSREEQQAENYRKMLLSMAKDIRVILIKFADRLHNMRTLEHLDSQKAKAIATETIEVYAPLAHRFGISRIQWELEDLSLKFLDPEAYWSLVDKVARTGKEREAYIREVEEPLMRELERDGIKAEITGRPKHLYSIYNKMMRRDKPFEEIYDLLAIRVITDTVSNCYHALGIVHTLYTPVQERFKDYIATPKSNMYQSLHTTTICPRGQMVEIQIRTHKMHRTAEEGIAAHWRYKEGKKEDELDKQVGWLRQLIDWQYDTTDPKEFMESLKIDLFKNEIFVFTPKGDLIRLPAGSTPVDFAFAIHTDIGLHCLGARVNGRIAPLNARLKSGDTVEIITSSAQRPSQDWINFVRTSRARSRIKRWLREEQFKHSVKLGEEILSRILRKHKIEVKGDGKLQEIAREYGYSEVTDLYAALGHGDLSVQQVSRKLVPAEKLEHKEKKFSIKRFIRRAKRPMGVRVQDVDNLMIHFAKCCQPIPGDHIIGFITRGRGVSVHRTDCPNSIKLMDNPERRVEVSWDVGKGQPFLARIGVVANDRPGLLRDVSKAISTTDNTNIKSANMEGDADRADGLFLVEVKNLQHLVRVMKKVKRVSGITKVERVDRLDE